MSFFRQKIHWESIWSFTGLLLHVPAIMAALSLIVCYFLNERFGCIPFLSTALFGFGSGQFLYHFFKKDKKNAHLWDAMIIAAIGWLLCSFLAAVPFYWIALERISSGVTSQALTLFTHPVNALFEAFSGYTSTGLSMLSTDSYFPGILMWWRSFLEWTGGIGLVVFILALTHLNKLGFELYYAEARSEQMSKNITRTAQWIWGIYFFYTLLAIALFWIFGMPIWEALNHGLAVISTGGFTLSQSSFQNYSPLLQLTAMLMMILGAINFAAHFQMIRDQNWKILWKSVQLRLFFLFIVGGWGITLLLHLWNGGKGPYLPLLFDWTSALTTCGFSASKTHLFSPMVKLFLVMGMFVGGTMGSTSGGIKIQRLYYLLCGVVLRLKTITQKKEKQITKNYPAKQQTEQEEPPGVELPKTAASERLYTAGVLFFLWSFTLFIGWFFILKWTPKGESIDALFELTSAMSNVGLSAGFLSSELSSVGKGVFMFLMWIGRLEIIPAIVLLLSVPMTLKWKSKK